MGEILARVPLAEWTGYRCVVLVSPELSIPVVTDSSLLTPVIRSEGMAIISLSTKTAAQSVFNRTILIIVIPFSTPTPRGPQSSDLLTLPVVNRLDYSILTQAWLLNHRLFPLTTQYQSSPNRADVNIAHAVDPRSDHEHISTRYTSRI